MDQSELIFRSATLVRGVSVLYGLGFAGHLAGNFTHSRSPDLVGVWCLRGGFALQSVALLMRWSATGTARPPFLTLFEVLLFFSWIVGGIYLWTARKNRISQSEGATGLFVSALLFVVSALASLTPFKAALPLAPLLKSQWLPLHVLSAMAAYGFFVVSSLISISGLIRGNARTESIQALVSAFGVVVLGVVEAGALLESDALVWIAFLAFVVHLLLAAGAVLVDPAFETAAPKARDRGHPVRAAARVIFILAALSSAAIAFRWLRLPFSQVRYSLAGTGILALAALSVMNLGTARNCLRERLPSGLKLDHWAHRAAAWGVPLMVLALVSGGVWAHSAWGRFWSWEPKEVASLATCVFYAAYLELRKIRGAGQHALEYSAMVSVIGLLLLFFGFLGIGHFQPGSHSFLVGG